MKKIVNWQEEEKRGTFVDWLIIEALTAKKDTDDFFSHINEITEGMTKVELGMTINGIEVPVLKVLELIKGQINRMVEDRARSIVSGKIEEFRNHINEFSWSKDYD
jgi:hypothetical protein